MHLLHLTQYMVAMDEKQRQKQLRQISYDEL